MKITAAKIRELISEELIKAQPDSKRIAELSDLLLDETESGVRFSIDAQHINRLGLELVGKQETALSELIKNAYDADATFVGVTFSDYEKKGGRLLIEDDGQGMDEDVIKKTWMRLSTSEKIDNPVSETFQRPRAGQKGIGRFAVQRLGKKLTLETEVAGVDVGLRVEFDWDKDFVAGRDLDKIWSHVERYSKPNSRHGTRLLISSLRDKWSEAIFRRVWKSILFLQPPHRVAPISGGGTSDPGFRVSINEQSEDAVRSDFSIESSFLDYAIALVEGEIDSDGVATFKVKSERLDFEAEHVSETRFLLTGPVKLEARYFVYQSDSMPGNMTRVAAKIGQEFGGIRVYRNGFRVLPYGERMDDWLRLNEDVARRNIIVPANNYNFFGHLDLDQESNLLLQETSSREGLIENEAFDELKDFARKCVEWAALRVAAARGAKVTTKQKDFVSKLRKPTSAIREQIETQKMKVVSDVSENNKSSEIVGVLEEAYKVAEEFENQTQAQFDHMLQYENMLRILASLGVSISVFAHELKGSRNDVEANISLIEKNIDRNNENKIYGNIKKLRESVSRVFSLGNYIDNLISHTDTRSLSNRSVAGILETFFSQFSGYLDNQGISFEVNVDPQHLRTCPVHRSELDSVLFNFLTNSIKAIRRAKQDKPKILVRAVENNGEVVINFEDNGTGIDDDHIDSVFGAFYTTSDPDPDDITGRGTGLGLKIVSDIANSYGGSVSVEKPSEGYMCCLEFRIPSAKEE